MPRERIERTYAHCKVEILGRLERLGLTGPAHGVSYYVPALKLCRGCNQHVEWRAETCPHCGASIAEGEAAHAEKNQRVAEVNARAQSLLQELGMLPK
jgi:ribosomal protein L40E